MTLLLLEALGALLLFVFIVWWTMFAGRKRGEPNDAAADPHAGGADAPPARGPDHPPR
ncbi:hypothetical protein Tther_01602 [Tepidimonas thermarum]|uniref:Uncharacterized protein n=1 Tax=Tepidimonas thermarum TaxID=335431 RepID=A0A554X0F1_9BURK|nr:hypothetical protein [Tepidimonas thermarum]TSE29255.1 hypothetical protein Tther_01602 [Tepidimonas thermarum]